MKLLPICWVLLVTSCAFPVIKPDEPICYSYIKKLENGYYTGHCSCANFDFNYGKLAAVSPVIRYDLLRCHKNTGGDPDVWRDIISYLDEIYVWKDKHFKSKKKKTRSDRTMIKIKRGHSKDIVLLGEGEL